MVEVITFIYLFFIVTGLYLSFLTILLHYGNKNALEEERVAKIIPTLSILIPAYNEEDSIANTINSVLEADYPKDKLEIIVINDGSKDKTLDEIKKFGNKVVLLDKKNSGKADSLNQALKIAKGEIVGVVDADSYPEKNAMKHMVAYFEEDNVAAVTSAILVKSGGKILENLQAIEYAIIAWNRKLLQYLEGIYVTPGPLSMYKKDLVLSYGGFDTKNLTEDIEMTWKVLSHNHKVRIDLRAKCYTIAPNKISQWWKQRIRWNLGGFQTMAKYKKLIFNPKHGMMGLFVVPFFISTFLLSLVGLGVFFYILIKNLVNSYLISKYAVDAGTELLTFSELNLNPTVFAFFAVILILLGVSYLIYSQEVIYKHKIKIRDWPKFVVYLFIYLILYPFVTLHSIYRIIIGKKVW